MSQPNEDGKKRITIICAHCKQPFDCTFEPDDPMQHKTNLICDGCYMLFVEPEGGMQ